MSDEKAPYPACRYTRLMPLRRHRAEVADSTFAPVKTPKATFGDPHFRYANDVFAIVLSTRGYGHRLRQAYIGINPILQP